MVVVPFFRSHFLRLICEKRRLQEFENERLQEFEGKCECCRLPYYLRTHPRHIHVSGRVWNGWNAALISSKRKGLQADGSVEKARAKASKGEPVPSSVKCKLSGELDQLKSCLGKRKRSEALNSEQQDSVENKYNNDSALARPGAFWLNETGIKIFKKGVDALTVHALVQVKCVRLLKEFMGDDSYRRFVGSLFKSIAKFVLSVFDEEDFERIYLDKEKALDWKLFCSELCDEPGIAKEEFARRAIRKVIEESHRFSALREQDFCVILSEGAEEAKALVTSGGFMSGLFKFKFELSSVTESGGGCEAIHGVTYEAVEKWDVQKDDISESFRNNAIMEVLHNFVHLKEEWKTQLALELTCANVYRVYDTLVIEALKGIEIDELFKLCDDDSRSKIGGSPFSRSDISSVREVASHALYYFVQALYQLGWLKSMALKYAQDALVSSLSSAFGPYQAEVIEVIKIADHERRLKSKSSISLENIKYGLLLSSVRGFLKRGGHLKRITGGSPPEFSMIEFFKLARQKAWNAGDKEVGVEHLVLAMNTVLRRDQKKDGSRDPDDDCADEMDAKRLKRLKQRNVNRRQGSIEECSPVSRILHSRYRILINADSQIKSIRRLRNSREDISWIRKDTISLARA